MHKFCGWDTKDKESPSRTPSRTSISKSKVCKAHRPEVGHLFQPFRPTQGPTFILQAQFQVSFPQEMTFPLFLPPENSYLRIHAMTRRHEDDGIPF